MKSWNITNEDHDNTNFRNNILILICYRLQIVCVQCSEVVLKWFFLFLFVFQWMLLGVIDSDLALTNCISMTSQYTCPSTTYNSPLQCIVENFLAAVNVFLRRPSGGCVNTTSIGPHMSADRYGVTSNIIW